MKETARSGINNIHLCLRITNKNNAKRYHEAQFRTRNLGRASVLVSAYGVLVQTTD